MKPFTLRTTDTDGSPFRIRVNKIGFHRNGCHGPSFHVIAFTMEDDQRIERSMIGIVFNTPEHSAVLDVNEAAAGIIEYPNRWRGDQFDELLRFALQKQDQIERRGEQRRELREGAR